MKQETKAEKKPEPFTQSDFHALLKKAATTHAPSKVPAPAKKQTSES